MVLLAHTFTKHESRHPLQGLQYNITFNWIRNMSLLYPQPALCDTQIFWRIDVEKRIQRDSFKADFLEPGVLIEILHALNGFSPQS